MSNPAFSFQSPPPESPASGGQNSGWIRDGMRDIRWRSAFLLCVVRRFINEWYLQRAECELGKLGWQQADFSGVASDASHKLESFEKEQSHLMSEIGDLACEIETQMKQQEAASLESESGIQSLQTGLEEQKATFSELNLTISDLTDKIEKFERTLKRISYHITLLEQDFVKARARNLPPAEWETERVAMVNTRDELLAEQLDFTNRRAEMENQLKTATFQSEKLPGALSLQERALQDAILLHKQEMEQGESLILPFRRKKEQLEKQLFQMEKRKDGSFLELGRALADGGIAPRNQPEIFEAVMEWRAKKENFCSRAKMLADKSRRIPRDSLVLFYGVMGVMFLTLSLSVFYLIRNF